MSTAIAEVSADITRVIKIIEAADEYLDNAEDQVTFDFKRLEETSKQHPKNLYRTSKYLNEMKALEEFFDAKLKEIESKHWKKYNEQYARALSTRDIQAYIAGEPDYVQMLELKLEVVYMKRQFESLHEALITMGFQIKNITDLRVNELQEAVL